MSNNPYVNVNKVIDTSDNKRRVIDFLNMKNINNLVVPAANFVGIVVGSPNGNRYADIELTGATIQHIPFVIIDTNPNTTLSKDNFPTCETIETNGVTYLRLYATATPVGGNVLIKSVVLIEVK